MADKDDLTATRRELVGGRRVGGVDLGIEFMGEGVGSSHGLPILGAGKPLVWPLRPGWLTDEGLAGMAPKEVGAGCRSHRGLVFEESGCAAGGRRYRYRTRAHSSVG